MIWKLKIVRKFAWWVLKPRLKHTIIFDEWSDDTLDDEIKELQRAFRPTRIFLTHADEETGVRQMFREDEIQN